MKLKMLFTMSAILIWSQTTYADESCVPLPVETLCSNGAELCDPETKECIDTSVCFSQAEGVFGENPYSIKFYYRNSTINYCDVKRTFLEAEEKMASTLEGLSSVCAGSFESSPVRYFAEAGLLLVNATCELPNEEVTEEEAIEQVVEEQALEDKQDYPQFEAIYCD